jgi:hypothetical protein
LPRDFAELPISERNRISVVEVRRYLPEPFRSYLPDGLLREIVRGNLPGLPGAIMAGGAKTGYLLTEASGQFTFPPDWNPKDNRIHAVGRGGDGANATVQTVLDTRYYAGGGGGGAAWAMLVNRAFDPGFVADFNVAITSGDTWFRDVGFLLARSGQNSPSPLTASGGVIAGAGGDAGTSIGDEKNAGEAGTPVDPNGFINGFTVLGGRGGGAAGPHGTGLNGTGDFGFGGFGPPIAAGNNAQASDLHGGDGIDGTGKGWAFPARVNVGSGGGGIAGLAPNDGAGQFAPLQGGRGGLYGAGAGGGSVGFFILGGSSPGPAGAGAPGCILLVNNASA